MNTKQKVKHIATGNPKVEIAVKGKVVWKSSKQKILKEFEEKLKIHNISNKLEKDSVGEFVQVYIADAKYFLSQALDTRKDETLKEVRMILHDDFTCEDRHNGWKVIYEDDFDKLK